MDKQLVKDVLERVLEIEQQAESLAAEGDGYRRAAEREIKRQSHLMEIDTMKRARARVKRDFGAASDQADAQTAALTEKTARYIDAMTGHFKARKAALVDDLFAEIFGEED